MDTYMVVLADREDHEQRVLVTVPSSNTEDDVREFIAQPGLTAVDGRCITLVDPVVVSVRKLHIKRPVTTMWPRMQKASA
jgi:hypothetical protein